MTERVPDRPALRLEQLAGGPITLPGVWKLGETDLVEPGLAIAQQNAERGPWHGEPAPLAFRDRGKDVVEAVLLFGDLLGNVAHIDHALRVEMRPVVHRVDQVGAGAGLD